MADDFQIHAEYRTLVRTARALVPEVRKAVAVLSQIPEHKALVRQLYKHNTELDRITKGIRMTSTEGMYHIEDIPELI